MQRNALGTQTARVQSRTSSTGLYIRNFLTERAVAHFVHDAVVPDADAQPAVLTGQRLDAGRARLDAQQFCGTLDPPRDLGVKLAELP